LDKTNQNVEGERKVEFFSLSFLTLLNGYDLEMNVAVKQGYP
jgi:hypothetical protein